MRLTPCGGGQSTEPGHPPTIRSRRPVVNSEKHLRTGDGIRMAILGIDIGGSGVKGAPVDTVRGEFLAERYRVVTPQPSDVTSVVEAVAEVAGQFQDFDKVGITFPGVVVDGVTKTAANVEKSWLDAPAAKVFGERLGKPVTVLNDADAAGVA